MAAFYCGTCGEDTGIGLAWHCSYCRGHHVPIASAHCDRCGAARTPKLAADPGINDRYSPFCMFIEDMPCPAECVGVCPLVQRGHVAIAL